MIGENIPYCMVNDNVLMSLFVFTLVGTAYVFIMNGSSIVERVKSMFYYGKQQSSPYSDRTHIAGICNMLLYWQTILYSSIVALKYIQNGNKLFTGTEPYIALLTLALLFTLILPAKWFIYELCNRILFNDNTAQVWRHSYFFTIKLLGFLLFPLVVCCIFIKDFSMVYFSIYTIFAMLAYLFSFVTSSIKIIFRKKRNYLDIFLYLCALELLPMAILWRFIHLMNVYLTIKN